jgi:hypothetical protein
MMALIGAMMEIPPTSTEIKTIKGNIRKEGALKKNR